MKQIFYTGLLALTVAFGMTSCDKNELPDAPSLGVVVNDEYSKVSFEELGNSIVVPKLKSDAASKNASEFIHMYSSTPQILKINQNGGAAIYTGSYTANDISSINPASIILANGDGYSASSSNASNASDELVLGFLPYTSFVDFDLSASASIQLQATLLRGFLIVNVEDATENLRVQSATVQVGEGDKVSLLSDSDGDYYGYLQDGTYNVDVTYLLDGNEVIVSADDKVIAMGSAYTIELDLTANTPSSSKTTTSTETSDEATEGDQNDGDVLDTLSRIVSSTITTTDGDAGEPVIVPGAWTIDVDTNYRDVTSTISGTEAAIDRSINDDNIQGDRNDDDLFDTLERDIVTRYITVGDAAEGAGEVIDALESPWRIVLDNSEFTPSENTNPADGSIDPVDTYTYTEFSGAPAAVVSSGASVVSTSTAASDVAMVTRTTTTPQFSTVAAHTLTREATIVQNGDLDSPAPATLALTKGVAEDVTTLTALVATEQVANPIYVAVVADTADSGAWILNADATAAVWEVTQGGNALDVPAFAPVAGPGADLLADGKRYVADDAFADLSVAIEDIPVVADIAGTITVDFTAASGVVWSSTGAFTVTAPDGATATVADSVVTFNGAGEYVFALSNALGDTASYTATIDAAGDFTLSIGSAGVVTLN